jgi:hypothetical protein
MLIPCQSHGGRAHSVVGRRAADLGSNPASGPGIFMVRDLGL